MRPVFRSYLTLWILLLAAAASVTSFAEEAAVVDVVPPEIKSASVPAEIPEGTPVVAEVDVVDDIAVAEVTLRYRLTDDTEFASLRMNDEGNGHYRAVLPATGAGPTVDYFFEARDVGGNTVMRGNAGMPLRVTVLLNAGAVPGADDIGGPASRSPEKASYWKWVIGAAVVAALAALAQGGGGGDEPAAGGPSNPDNGTIDVTITGAPYPQP